MCVYTYFFPLSLLLDLYNPNLGGGRTGGGTAAGRAGGNPMFVTMSSP